MEARREVKHEEVLEEKEPELVEGLDGNPETNFVMVSVAEAFEHA